MNTDEHGTKHKDTKGIPLCLSAFVFSPSA
jgi:hypothetical protein